MLAVRLLHVLAMALALGGATLAWWSFRRGTTPAAASLELAAAYERGFWAASGVLVMTGVGNLGGLAPHVPAAATRWGTAFAVKLLLVLVVLALSLVRTLVVARRRRAEDATEAGSTESSTDALGAAYGATALSLAVLVALAEVLAHG